VDVVVDVVDDAAAAVVDVFALIVVHNDYHIDYFHYYLIAVYLNYLYYYIMMVFVVIMNVYLLYENFQYQFLLN